MVHQMLGMHRIDVFAGLILHHLDKVFQLVDRVIDFAVIKIGLRFIEFLEQVLRHTVTIDVVHLARVYHALAQRRNRRLIVRAAYILVRQRWTDSPNSKPPP
jgi:hypothetical protein